MNKKNLPFELGLSEINTITYLSRLHKIESEENKILNYIINDKRTEELNNKLLNKGTIFVRFEPQFLAAWYLWSLEKYGKETTEKNYNDFLENEEYLVYNTIWILGVEIEEVIQLNENLWLIPIDKMPLSNDKEIFLQQRHKEFPHSRNLPKVALVSGTKIHKFSKSSIDQKSFIESSDELINFSLIFNMIDGISCIPYFHTTYVSEDKPPGLFAGYGGGFPFPDLYGNKFSKLSEGSIDQYKEILKLFNKLGKNKKNILHMVLKRLSQSKRKEEFPDKILDLTIALEMILLDDNPPEQLALAFRIRGSWLIGKTYNDRSIIYNDLKDLYNYRSKIVHSGSFSNKKKLEKVKLKYNEYCNIAEKIILEYIFRTKIEWSKLILGEKAQQCLTKPMQL